ncbi:hypothetical protein [Kamptonema formosum]|uniref:hypothetical protein n=1 Tax=Kamptonema formosum TaxID=331992 RepID=UPI0012DC658A|nr:hypothetical protein [Oscillatoria sp. PCC 10802]
MGTLLKVASIAALAVGVNLSASGIASATTLSSRSGDIAFNRPSLGPTTIYEEEPPPKKPPTGGDGGSGGTAT